jgi:hypothetical protein
MYALCYPATAGQARASDVGQPTCGQCKALQAARLCRPTGPDTALVSVGFSWLGSMFA